MNPILLQSYQLGVVIGVILLSTLILFPGTNHTIGASTSSTGDDEDTSAAAADPITTSSS